MTKFTFKDTGKEIKVGDVFYYVGYKNKTLYLMSSDCQRSNFGLN